MPQSGSEVSDDFEFIETPAAPTPVPPPEDYGVRTTTVSRHYLSNSIGLSTRLPGLCSVCKADNDSVVPFNQEWPSPCRLCKQRQLQ